MHRFDRRRFLAAAGAAMLGAGAARTAWAADGAGPIPEILKATGAPALAGGVVTDKGLAHFHVGGVRRQGAPEAVGETDLWHLGSNGKAMTAALYGRLVDAGRARWGATVPELFPDLAVDPAWKTTTVEQLLGHRAGVEERSTMQGGWLMKAHADTRPIREQRTDVAKLIFGGKPTGKAGAFAYANFNYVLVGAAIERIADAAWEDAIVADLFRPLGIATAGFGAPKGPNPWGHRPAKSGAQKPPIALVPVDPAGIADNPAALGPAGRIHMSVQDYARFTRLFLTRGDGVLKPETVVKLSTPVPGAGQAYALGWGVAEGVGGANGPVLMHEGSNTMWHAITAIAPGKGVALIGVSNAPPPTGATARFLKHMQDEFIGN